MPYPHTRVAWHGAVGRVLDAETRTPIRGAEVYLVSFPGNEPEHITYTDADGHFEIRAFRQFHLAVAGPDGADCCPAEKWYEGRISHPDYSGQRFGAGTHRTDVFLKPKVWIAVGMPLTEALSSVKGLGGRDITAGLRPLPKFYGKMHEGSYWRLDSYNAYITLSSDHGKIIAMTYWTQRDIDYAHSVVQVEQSVLAVKFDVTQYEVSVEKSKGS